MSEQSVENGAPVPTRVRFEFRVRAAGYVCGECGSVVGSKVLEVQRHDDWHTRVTSPVEHRLLSPPHPARCTCGWEPGLGEMVTRAFDRHLRDTCVTSPGKSDLR